MKPDPNQGQGGSYEFVNGERRLIKGSRTDAHRDGDAPRDGDGKRLDAPATDAATEAALPAPVPAPWLPPSPPAPTAPATAKGKNEPKEP